MSELLLRYVTDGLDVVAIGIAHKGAVVVVVIFRPQTRLMKDLRIQSGGGIKEQTHSITTRRDKCDMTLPKAFTSRAWANPELRLRIDAETDDLPELHHTTSSERAQNGLVEGSTLCSVGTLDRQVIEHE